jgi:FkbM family methyltransferase
VHAVEKFCVKLRHSPAFRNADWIWNFVRPLYNGATGLFAARGLVRHINGTDTIRVSPAFRNVPETYEPEIWPQVMACVKPGDTVADVGAFIGLYALALGQRVGPRGRVVAFEPSPDTFRALQGHIILNRFEHHVEAVHAAVSNRPGSVRFQQGASEAKIAQNGSPDAIEVRCVTLDEHFASSRLDLLKIDVEGFEQAVLEGATQLLSDKTRAPHYIFVEVHPYNWAPLGVTSDSLLQALTGHDYQVFWPDGSPVRQIERYGEVIARRSERGRPRSRHS